MLRVVFLHIPKTAGQSIHSEFKRLLGKTAIAPIRVNADWSRCKDEDLTKYQVFSGHLDWDKLDFVPDPKITVTVLRDPRQRIISFYLYLKKEAGFLTESALSDPSRKGMKAITTLSCEDYFCNRAIPERGFIDNHYDNFYTYYFAGRNFAARGRLARELKNLPDARQVLLRRALNNLRKIDYVARFTQLEAMERFLNKKLGQSFSFAELKINVNLGSRNHLDPAMLAEHGFTARTMERISAMAEMDEELMKTYFDCYDF